MDNYGFGYPKQCIKCSQDDENPHQLKVKPYFCEVSGFRLMLIGQDPTIFHDSERVRFALMLDEPRGQIRRWLRDLLGDGNLEKATVYTTNIVKCSFKKPPSQMRSGGLPFLSHYFGNCRQYLLAEIDAYRPELVITFGEPAHCLFVSCMSIADCGNRSINTEMKKAFNGSLYSLVTSGHRFDYSPCLHIKTFRVAETYGPSVARFRIELQSYLKTRL